MSSISFRAEVTRFDNQKTILWFDLSEPHVQKVLGHYARKNPKQFQTESPQQTFKHIEEELKERYFGGPFKRWKDLEDDSDGKSWQEYAIDIIAKSRHLIEKPLYALLVSKIYKSAKVLQLSHNKEELEAIAAAFNLKADGWGSAEVEEFNEQTADWHLPSFEN